MCEIKTACLFQILVSNFIQLVYKDSYNYEIEIVIFKRSICTIMYTRMMLQKVYCK